jgi:hypothetical protein
MTTPTNWIAGLSGADESALEEIVSQLESCGAPPAELRSELIAQLDHSDSDSLQRYWCLTLLGRDSDSATEPETAAIAAYLAEQHDMEVRQRAAWALGQLATVAARTRPALEQAASATNPRLARLAQQALDEL